MNMNIRFETGIRLETGDSIRIDVWKQFGTPMCDSLKDSYVAMDIDQLVYNPVYGVITEQVDNAIQSKIKEYEYK